MKSCFAKPGRAARAGGFGATLLPGLLAAFWLLAAGGASAQNPAQNTQQAAQNAASPTLPTPLASPDSANVVLVTLDGVRWQEVFGGADPARLPRRLRARLPATAAARRRALLPFLWDSVAGREPSRRGQLLGNRALGSRLDVRNRSRLSYPGYNELLSGAPDDAHLLNNRAPLNPNETVLEAANRAPGLAGRVAAFSTWAAFGRILNPACSGLLVDAGRPDGHERADSLTWLAARAYLARARPRVLFVAFGNTDTEAHLGHYAGYLAAAHAADRYLAQLWAYLQSQPQYRGRTTLLVTTDHGRGRSWAWSQHGRWLPGSGQTWLAALGPGIAPTGEAGAPSQHFQGELDGLVARCLGLDFPAAAPVLAVGKSVIE